MRIQTFWQKNIFFALALCLLANGLLPFLQSSHFLSSANAKAAASDAQLICTGNGLKWISKTTYAQTGQLKFIKAPETESTKIDLEQSCPLVILSDNPTDGRLLDAIAFKQLDYFALVYRAFDAANLTSYYNSGYTSRAPPIG
ncbi:hypothetical protein [Catenovulum sediminis]|uniref:Uncharacterized protein n=1 Tax=Catenovulum sediminis TaxID=1740262 RepID=A0ABV1RFA5_9ALTE